MLPHLLLLIQLLLLLVVHLLKVLARLAHEVVQGADQTSTATAATILRGKAVWLGIVAVLSFFICWQKKHVQVFGLHAGVSLRLRMPLGA